MANEQYVFINKSNLPSREQWQKSIDVLGYKFEIDPELNPSEDSGYSPCRLEGKNTGVEIYYQSVKDLLDDSSEIEELAKGRDFCVSFRWGGSMAECTCAIIASMALLKDYDGIVSYELEDPSDLETLTEDLKSCMPEAIKELSRSGPPEDPKVEIKKDSDKPKARKPWWKIW